MDDVGSCSFPKFPLTRRRLCCRCTVSGRLLRGPRSLRVRRRLAGLASAYKRVHPAHLQHDDISGFQWRNTFNSLPPNHNRSISGPRSSPLFLRALQITEPNKETSCTVRRQGAELLNPQLPRVTITSTLFDLPPFELPREQELQDTGCQLLSSSQLHDQTGPDHNMEQESQRSTQATCGRWTFDGTGKLHLCRGKKG